MAERLTAGQPGGGHAEPAAGHAEPAAGQPWRNGGRRFLLLATAVLLAGGAVGGAAAAFTSGARRVSAGGTGLATVAVTRATLTTVTQVTGSLGFAGSVSVVDELAGVAYTRLPQPGQVVRRDGRLFEVDGSAVFLFYGARPAWRALWLGIAPGPDVAQLDANMIALGYATRATLPVSTTFALATQAAVERWQYARGLAVTGGIALGQIAYAPGPLRLADVAVGVGQAAQPGATVLTATSDTPVVLAALPVSEEYLVRVGDRVTVLLPDGSAAGGRVTWVARTATAAQQSPAGGAGPAAAASPGSGELTVALMIRLDRFRAPGGLDQAPVTVNIVSARARDVLAVPVTALEALAGGGYAVTVGRGAAARLVPVRTGLFTSTSVAVTGPGLSPGVLVQVPAP